MSNVWNQLVTFRNVCVCTSAYQRASNNTTEKNDHVLEEEQGGVFGKVCREKVSRETL